MNTLNRARAQNENANLAIGAGSKAVETCSKDGDLGKVEEEKRARSDHVRKNVGEYAGLLGRACPAGVYEYVDQEGAEVGNGEGWKGKKLVINSQVCTL
jgi:electron-transferring-flavoprotein dehydrogenase